MATMEDFQKLDIRVGKIIEVEGYLKQVDFKLVKVKSIRRD